MPVRRLKKEQAHLEITAFINLNTPGQAARAANDDDAADLD